MVVLTPPAESPQQSNTVYLPVQAAVDQTGYCAQYLRRLLRAGRLKAIKVGQMWLIDAASLAAFIERSQVGLDRRCGPKHPLSTSVYTPTPHPSTTVYTPNGGPQ